MEGCRSFSTRITAFGPGTCEGTCCYCCRDRDKDDRVGASDVGASDIVLAPGDLALIGARHLGYVLNRFPRISETFIASELLELRRQGERVTVFTLPGPEEAFTHRFLDELDVPIVYLPYPGAWQPLRSLRALSWVLRTCPRGWLGAAGVPLEGEGRFPRLRRLHRLLQACVQIGRAHV